MSAGIATHFACSGCGSEPDAREPYPFRCPRSPLDGGGGGYGGPHGAARGDPGSPGAGAAGRNDADHVLRRRIEPAWMRFPARGPDNNPFVRYRTLLHSWHRATSAGMSDADFVELVERLDQAVAEVDGKGFRVTPFARHAALSESLGFTAPGGVWIKDETGNVSGSHKARHLMGLALHLEVAEQLGWAPARSAGGGPRLAIASCGNAALGAAVVARAARRPLEVFVPPDAEPAVPAALERLDATIRVCARESGTAGDPCYLAFRRALAAGALPFCCQGSDNGLTLEGGQTLGYEIVSAQAREGLRLDRCVIQVGGGALASSCVQAFRDARLLGAASAPPRIHTVQTRGAYPLRRAWEQLAARILGGPLERVFPESGLADDDQVAARLFERAGSLAAEEALMYAARHRSEFMRPWDTEPRSVARGILDDETYDWLEVVTGMLQTGGWPLVVSEESLIEAHAQARSLTGIDVSATGSAGLAGLLELRRAGVIPGEETVAVLFTGVER